MMTAVFSRPQLLGQLASAEPERLTHVAAAAVSSYNRNNDLIETEESFRIRFPA